MQLIERIPISSQVVSGIQELIREQGLKPGDRLPTEKALGEMFGVGRSTVREALRALQALGIVNLQQGRGAFVSEPVDRAERGHTWFKGLDASTRDYVEIRLAIEPLSVRLAIERAEEEEVAELARILSMLIQSSSKQDPLLLATYDEAFHMQIAQSTHNKLIASIYESICKEILETRIQSFSVPERMKTVIEPHRKILDAFYDHDPETGEQAMYEHIREAFEDIRGM